MELGNSTGAFGGMAERFMAVVLKTTGLIAPGVRIPLPPLKAMWPFLFWYLSGYIGSAMTCIWLYTTIPRLHNTVDNARQRAKRFVGERFVVCTMFIVASSRKVR